jgi:hypothetical protein
LDDDAGVDITLPAEAGGISGDALVDSGRGTEVGDMLYDSVNMGRDVKGVDEGSSEVAIIDGMDEAECRANAWRASSACSCELEVETWARGWGRRCSGNVGFARPTRPVTSSVFIGEERDVSQETSALPLTTTCCVTSTAEKNPSDKSGLGEGAF